MQYLKERKYAFFKWGEVFEKAVIWGKFRVMREIEPPKPLLILHLVKGYVNSRGIYQRL